MSHRMISVIIPVYQVSEYVERCLRSVMAQSYTDIECVIVDDATKDDSIVKCERLIKEYNENLRGRIRFKILHHEVNRGLSASRNTGTAAATGDYLFYLDSDDYIAPNCIERLVSVVDNDPSVEFVQGNGKMICDGNESLLYSLGEDLSLSNNDDVRKAFYKNRNIYISVWNKLLKKSFVEEAQLYCREGLVFEDLLWTYYLLKALDKAYLCKEVTYYYEIRPGSISTVAKPKDIQCYTVIFDEIFRNLTAGKEQEEINGFLYYFIKRYISCVKIVPSFKDTIRLYRDKAREYSCWKVFFVLFLSGFVGRFGNPSKLLDRVNRLRWRLKN